MFRNDGIIANKSPGRGIHTIGEDNAMDAGIRRQGGAKRERSYSHPVP